MRRFFLACAAVLAVALVSSGQAQKSSALINEALDRVYALALTQNTPLQQIFKKIADDTGVPVEVPSDALDLLPYGEGTALKVKIENQTLRGGLQAIARSLGLAVEVKEEVVQLVPMPALKRLGRRATVDELRVLDLLARTPVELKGDRVAVK